MSAIIISLVTFKPNLHILLNTIISAKASKFVKKIVIIDNGCEERVRAFAAQNGCEYIRPSRNVGFGGAHNLAIRKYATEAEYFLILNPDVIIHSGCLEELVKLMNSDSKIVLSCPSVLSPDGTIQRAHKRLPSIKVLFGRRFLPRLFNKIWPQEFSLYELCDIDLSKPHFIPSVSGCFMLFRSEKLLCLGGFDERYFMYMEDADISFRANKMGSVVYWPYAKITHIWERGSHKNWSLTVIHMISVLRYFVKWGLLQRAEVLPYKAD